MIHGGRYNHGSAKIDQYRMIIVGGEDAHAGNYLSSGYIYDVRTQQSTPLPNDMPEALTDCCVVANDANVYVIGGKDNSGDAVNTVYRLCLKTEKWSIMAPMATARFCFAAALKDNYIYIFGGCDDDHEPSERYSIDNNTWGGLPDMPNGNRCYPCAVATAGSEIYIVGGSAWSVEVFDTATLTWKNETHLDSMPEIRRYAATVVLKKKYLVLIGGGDQYWKATASCLIFDFSSNSWSTTPASMDLIEARRYHTAAVLDGKIVVAGGRNASVECIDVDALLEYAPLHYPLPDWILNRIFDNGKCERELVPCTVFDKLKAKKRKIN